MTYFFYPKSRSSSTLFDARFPPSGTSRQRKSNVTREEQNGEKIAKGNFCVVLNSFEKFYLTFCNPLETAHKT